MCGWFVSVKVMNACQQALRVAESGDLKNIVTGIVSFIYIYIYRDI